MAENMGIHEIPVTEVSRLTYIRTRNADGKISDPVPVAAEAENVYMAVTPFTEEGGNSLKAEWFALVNGVGVQNEEEVVAYRATADEISAMFSTNRSVSSSR